MRVRLTLDGNRNDVLAVIGLALENGILDQMETVNKLETDDLPDLNSRGPRKVPNRSLGQMGIAKQFKPRAQYAKPFEHPGTRVRTKTFHGRGRDISATLGLQIGDVGTVQSYELKGNGVKVEVKWDRTGETNWINGSYLEVIRKVPLSERT